MKAKARSPATISEIGTPFIDSGISKSSKRSRIDEKMTSASVKPIALATAKTVLSIRL